MTAKEFESYTRSIALNTIKLERGEMSQKDYVKTMKVILGKETFEETIKILDEAE
jgi:DNA polymerase III sliding clamp (beta) subunit (PCNA family)